MIVGRDRLCTTLIVLAMVTSWALSDISNAQITTAFTYQGELKDSGFPAEGPYDFEFSLFDAPTAGIEFAGPVMVEDVEVLDGLFTARVDFGMNVFGIVDSWLEIRVREGGSVGAFTALAPRQELTPAPLATHALNVAEGAVGSAQMADGAVTSGKLADGSVTALKIDPSGIQMRVGESCAPGFYLQAIAEDGTVSCAPDQSTEVAGLEQRVGALEQMLEELPTTSETGSTGVCFDSSGRLLPCPGPFVTDDLVGLWEGTRTADPSVVDICAEDGIELNIGPGYDFTLETITQRRTGVAPEIVNFTNIWIEGGFVSHQYTAYAEDISFTVRFNTNDATGDWVQTNGACFGTWTFVKVP
ncbi:MAG: hypothetical protein R6V56_01040 [Lentisphaeria bacterium]